MKTILLAIDAIEPEKNATSFACFICRLTNSNLTGVFLENVLGKSKPDKNKNTPIEENIAVFQRQCNEEKVQHEAHRSRKVPAKALITESRFGDLLIMSPDISFKAYDGKPTDFVKQILKKTECPIVISPPSFNVIDEIVFAYDGSASAMFAIKQFTSFFSQLSGRKVTVIQMTKNGKWPGNDKTKLRGWLIDHYSDINFEMVTGDMATTLFEWLSKRKNAFIVMGAYGRSSWSKYFKSSYADLVIQIWSQPIFIAHT